MSTDFLSRVFPVLQPVLGSGAKRVELVNQTFVEEVLQDIHVLDFGKGMTAKGSVGMWRTRGEHKPLVGEFRFQPSSNHKMRSTRRPSNAASSSSSGYKPWDATGSNSD